MTRTELVHHHIRAFLDSRAPGSVRIVSMWAGQGRELLPVLAGHPRRSDVHTRLVERDPLSVAAACETVSELRLDWQVDVVCADAGLTDAYAGAVPADLVLLCGVFGSLGAAGIRTAIDGLPQLCGRRATVVWTHERRPDDPTPSIRGWFSDAGFQEDAFESSATEASWVGVQRFTGEPQPLGRGVRLFTLNGERP
jgi:hypothetical protein